MLCLAAVAVVVFSPSVRGSDSPEKDNPDTKVLYDQLLAEEGWPKVHAAEALLAQGEEGKVRTVFLGEAIKNENIPEYRIGIWRVLSRAAEDPAEQAYWNHRIVEAFLDEEGVDRLHAIETIGKLNLDLPEDQLAVVREYVALNDCPFGHWVLWQHGEDQSLDRLEAMSIEGESIRAKPARYILNYNNEGN